MSFSGSYSIQQLIRRLVPKALILLYHRVSTQPFDPQLLCVRPDHFSEHMQILRRDYHPLSLQSLQRRRALNLWPSRSVVVTFDDGYADNFYQARTILEAQNLPATVFVTSGKVDTEKEFWWDELEQIFLLTPNLPLHLEILIDNQKYICDLDETGANSLSTNWNVLMKANPTQRQKIYLDLMKRMRNLDVDTRESLLSELAIWAGTDRYHGRQGYLAVKADELRSLPQNGLIDVGAHTVNHSVLATLPLAFQQAEIVESKISLEKILDRPILTFAYPFGERRDYTRDTTRLVREAGFSCACSNFAGQVTALSDPYQLPRFIVRDWDGDTFARQLGEWFRG